MTATTSDLNATDLVALLSSLLDPGDAANLETWAAGHLPADGLTPVEVFTNPGLNFSVTSTVPDAEGANPQFLEIIGQAGDPATIDTTNITGLHAILFQGVNSGEDIDLFVTGSHNAKVYTSDLAGGGGADSGDHFALTLDVSGNIKVVVGDDYGDSVTDEGSGHDHIVLGNGNGDIVDYIGSGTFSATLGIGADDAVWDQSTATTGNGPHHLHQCGRSCIHRH